jgi:peptidoglycan DL-endopeptidase CwlO
MLKQKDHNRLPSRRAFAALLAVVMVSLLMIGGGLAKADKFDEKIQRLQSANDIKQGHLDRFTAQADSYQDAVDRIQREIDRLTDIINKTKGQIDAVKKEIAKAQADIDHNRKVLGQSIRAMYQEGDVSTLEILASSHDLSDFVNKQQYRLAVQDKVKNTFDRITALKVRLEQKQNRLRSIVRDNRIRQDSQAQAQAKQQELLSYSTKQKNSFEKEINKVNSRISELRSQQAAANAAHFGNGTVAGDPNHGGYPAVWDNAAQDSMLDDWGMFNRECVSYTAWKVFQTFGYMPYWGGRGNANQWPSSAEADGIATGSTPRVHSVAIWMTGYYGHAMWVEDVYSNGNIRVSQYNYDYQGHYSEMTIPSGGMTYIYFE